jgi:hypothetical protein
MFSNSNWDITFIQQEFIPALPFFQLRELISWSGKGGSINKGFLTTGEPLYSNYCKLALIERYWASIRLSIANSQMTDGVCG